MEGGVYWNADEEGDELLECLRMSGEDIRDKEYNWTLKGIRCTSMISATKGDTRKSASFQGELHHDNQHPNVIVYNLISSTPGKLVKGSSGLVQAPRSWCTPPAQMAAGVNACATSLVWRTPTLGAVSHTTSPVWCTPTLGAWRWRHLLSYQRVLLPHRRQTNRRCGCAGKHPHFSEAWRHCMVPSLHVSL